MNSNPLPHLERLNRIRKVSRGVRYFFFACMACIVWVFTKGFLLSIPSFTTGEHPVVAYRFSEFVLIASSLGYFSVLLAWYWLLAKLFGYYARGAIFGPEPIRCIRWAGILCIAGWALMSIRVMMVYLDMHYRAMPLPTPYRIKSIQMGFFDFDFMSGIDFGLLAAGIIIVLIAWIMEEGHKMQEEQELTV